LSMALQTSYQDRQTVALIGADSLAPDGSVDTTGLQQHLNNFGSGAYFDETYIFDINASYEFSEAFTFYGGVNNITDEEPFATQTAWPVGPRGRFFFLGVTYTN
ncbi:MAG: TonB-dependent receptor, partial [Henriciella sp.]